MGQYSIKEVETLSGIKAHTIRIWEQRYDFLKPNRTDTNIRFYTDDQLRMLLNIGTLNRHGVKISKIAEMPPEKLSAEVLKVQNTDDGSDMLLDSLVLSMLDFDEQRFEKTLSNAIIKYGFDLAISTVVFPFLQRAGILWQTGGLKVVQEHFISNLIRRKLLVAVDNAHFEEADNAKRFLLFLPEGEMHELTLIYTEYLLRRLKNKVIYLGISVPIDDLQYAVKFYNPHYLVTFLTVATDNSSLSSYLRKLSVIGGGAKLIVGGAQIEMTRPALPENAAFVKSLDDLHAAIA